MFNSRNLCDGASGARRKRRRKNEDFRNALNLYFIELEVEAPWKAATRHEWWMAKAPPNRILMGNYIHLYLYCVHCQWPEQKHGIWGADMALVKRELSHKRLFIFTFFPISMSAGEWVARRWPTLYKCKKMSLYKYWQACVFVHFLKKFICLPCHRAREAIKIGTKLRNGISIDVASLDTTPGKLMIHP